MNTLPADQTALIYQRIQTTFDHAGHEPRNAVRDLRILFDQIFQKLTENEGRLFSGVFQRSVYVSDALGLSAAARDHMHGFRKFANRVVHEDGLAVSQDDFRRHTASLCYVVQAVSGEAPPDALARLMNDYREAAPAFHAGRPNETLDMVRVIISRIEEPRVTARGTRFFMIEGLDERNDRLLKIGLRDYEQYKFSDLHPLLKPWRILHLTALESGDKPDVFFSTLDTLVVLEPDLLIDVTEVAECFTSQGREARLFLLSKFSHSEAGDAALRGKMVNDIFDLLIENPDATDDHLLRTVLAANSLRAARFGPDAMDRLSSEITTGFIPSLRAMARDLAGHARVRVEPSFFSPLYGLQGRLDVLEEPEGDGRIKKVLELKSGRAPTVYKTADGALLSGGPRENVWPNHRFQVIAYHMLLRSAFGPDIRGRGAIFYPGDAAHPLRDVEGAPQAERELLEIRNQIVYFLLELAEGRGSVLNELLPSRMFALPPYKKTEADALETLLREAGPDALAYVKASASFVLREWHAAKTGGAASDPERAGNGFAALWLDQPAVKEARFNLLRGLTLRHFDRAANTAVFDLKDCPPHNFREGDIGVLYEWNADRSPLKNQVLRGSITRLTADTLDFSFRSRQSDTARFAGGAWAIEHDLYESSVWGQLQGLFHFLSADSRTRRLLLGLEAPARREPVWEPQAGLMPNQQRIVRDAFAAPDYYLIQGPPGTGKTSTVLVHLARAYRERTGENIVVLAYTNRAVREIARKLERENIPFTLLSGRDDEYSPAVNPATFSVADERRRLQETRLFLATVTSFQSRIGDILTLARPSTVIVDEASQLVEPQLAGLLARFRKWILIGDQKQLPAVIQQPESGTRITDERLIAAGFTGFRQSLFERLYETAVQNSWNHAFGMLENHFRMHVDIAELINRHYGNRLVAGQDGQQTHLEIPDNDHPLDALLARSRTLFIPSDRPELGRTHPQEARRIAAWIRHFAGRPGGLTDAEGNQRIGVITPFRAQITAIREALGDELCDQVTIDTVERFQGSERDIILISLAIGDYRQLPSLQAIDPAGTTDRKLLVAVSRARFHLIVHGYSPALSGDPHYTDLLDRIRRQNGLVESSPALRQWFGA